MKAKRLTQTLLFFLCLDFSNLYAKQINHYSNNYLFNSLKEKANYLIKYQLNVKKDFFNVENPLLTANSKKTIFKKKNKEVLPLKLIAILNDKEALLFNGKKILKIKTGDKLIAYKHSRIKDKNKANQIDEINNIEEQIKLKVLKISLKKGTVILENLKSHAKIQIALQQKKGE